MSRLLFISHTLSPGGVTRESAQNEETSAHISRSNSEVFLYQYLSLSDAPRDIFELSAAEARERLRANKRRDPRGLEMSLEEKYRIVSSM